MTDISKAYDPKLVEDRWYADWLAKGHFTANANSSKPAYSIVIPPPNVTGMLHMGHVLNNTIQDILARKARMDGKEVLWLPGTDHAGIATEGMVSKQIWREEKKSKRDIGRDEFIKRVWTWKEKHGGIIIQQLKKLGCSCDWTRERFTMEPHYVGCVQRVFVELYKKGLIYRGKRMVNWCPATLTALSDEEVDMEPQKGFLYYFKVEVAEQPGTFLTIATTRPETIPGDTAVAVNPKDPRYAPLIGKHVVRPLPIQIPREQKLIPIIGDEHVDFEFGTGVLKVTPAHDKADFEIMARQLGKQIRIANEARQRGENANTAGWMSGETPEVIDERGVMTALAGETLAGLDRFEARAAAIERLREIGALVKEEPYENKVGFSQRAKVPIEPRLSEQWFLKYPSVETSKSCVAEARMKFHPDRWAKVYDHWLTNIQDWCISRQLWWGHRIPTWTGWLNDKFLAAIPTEAAMSLRGDAGPIARRYDDQAISFSVPSALKVGVEVCLSRRNGSTFFRYPSEDGTCTAWDIRKGCLVTAATVSMEEARLLEENGFTQDPDVLDTWFSSWLWPFATMGWPEQTETLKKFYPTTDLVTGPDIIFFWVARMIMAGYEFMDEMPFRNVYFTGIVRDKQGRKMSKTLGNSADPLELIAQYGADAVRFGTMRSAPLGADVLFDESDVEQGRNFCNKLWNASRLRQMQGIASCEVRRELLTSDDHYILAKLDDCIRAVSASLDGYKFNEAAHTLYGFFWGAYCDWYLEVSKSSLQGTDAALKANACAVMDVVLKNILRLLHPFMPFITEELWQGLGFARGETIQFAEWPKALGLGDGSVVDWISQKYALVVAGRNLRAEKKIPPSKKANFKIKAKSADIAARLQNEIASLRILLNAEQIEFVAASFEASAGTPAGVGELGSIFMPLEGLVDPAAERKRVETQLAKLANEIATIDRKLANEAFVAKAPTAVVEQQRAKRTELTRQQTELQKMLA